MTGADRRAPRPSGWRNTARWGFHFGAVGPRSPGVLCSAWRHAPRCGSPGPPTAPKWKPHLVDLARNRAKADLFGGIPRRRVILSSVLSLLPVSSCLRLLEGELDVFEDDEARESACCLLYTSDAADE